MKRFAFTLVLPAILFATAPARAFTEDVCYPPEGGIVECTPLPKVCLPAGTDTPPCRTAAAAAFATANSKYPDARSTVHVDVPYIMAQAIGFSATDAYWIAAYSEATDRGSFEPRDATGALVGGGTLKTASVTGLQRTDFTSGGVLIHFSAPRNPSSPAPLPGVDGLHPDATDADHEIILAHLRKWAMAGSGAASPDCAGGLTDPSAAGDNATGSTCYASAGMPATINGSVTLFDGPHVVQAVPETKDFSILTGFQIIQDSDAGTATSDTFDAVVGGTPAHIADARLGVYLHAFGDRISHHVCLDDGYMFGPTESGTTWEANMTSAQCAQGLHSLRHMWETGIDYASLGAADRTTVAYLGYAYDEIVAFATARGVLAPGASAPTARAAMVAELTTALETADVSARLAALHAATCSHNLTAFPGEVPCPTSGASASSGGNAAAADDGSKGCAFVRGDRGAFGASALIGFCAIAAQVARRRRKGSKD